MEYLLLLAAIALFYLSYRNYANYNKLKDTGKIPVLIAAKQNTNLYLLLGLFFNRRFFNNQLSVINHLR